MCKDDDIQCVWSHISPNTIEEVILLKDIVHMYITTRGQSQQSSSDYKLQQKKRVKGTRSLRKELDSQ